MRTVFVLSLLLFSSAAYSQSRAGYGMGVPPRRLNPPEVFDPTGRVSADTPATPPPLVGDAGTVSVADLSLPPKAAKELKLSQKAFEAGDNRSSIEHLERALKIYPDIPSAHNKLGVRYSRLHEFDRALAEFQIASASEPKSAQVMHNLGATYFLLKRFSEAEVAARRALDIDRGKLATRFILGTSLALQGRYTSEAEQMLGECKEAYPLARLMLVESLLRHGRPGDAIVELRAYLKMPNADQKEEAARALASLTSPMTSGTQGQP